MEPIDLWLRGRLPFGLWDRYVRASWSQEGEDLLFERLHPVGALGFYVDIGAHHPMRFSNTYRLYRRGWRGINVDALPGSMRLFDLARPRDTNIEAAIAKREGRLWYHQFNEPALNTLDPVQAMLHARNTRYRVLRKTPVQTQTLSALLHRYLPSGQVIDLMNVDTEGFELQVLSSNDWHCFRPHWILAETLRCSFEKVPGTPLARFLAKQGYRPVARTLNTVFFQEQRK